MPSCDDHADNSFCREVPTLSLWIIGIFGAAQLQPHRGSDEAEFLLNFEAGFERLGRILILPPGAAPERLAFLRQVVARTMRNPKLIAEGEKSHRYIDFIDAETTAETVAGTLANLSQQQRDLVRKILTAEPSQR